MQERGRNQILPEADNGPSVPTSARRLATALGVILLRMRTLSMMVCSDTLQASMETRCSDTIE